MTTISDFTKAVIRENGSDLLRFYNSSRLSWLVDTHGIDDFYVDGYVHWTIRLSARSVRRIFIEMVVRFDQVDLDPVISEDQVTPTESVESSAKKFLHQLKQYRDPVDLWHDHQLREFMDGSITVCHGEDGYYE